MDEISRSTDSRIRLKSSFPNCGLGSVGVALEKDPEDGAPLNKIRAIDPAKPLFPVYMNAAMRFLDRQ
jgi:hypothetical protein